MTMQQIQPLGVFGARGAPGPGRPVRRVVTEDSYVLTADDVMAAVVCTADDDTRIYIPVGLPPGFRCDVIVAGGGRVILRALTPAASVAAAGGLVAADVPLAVMTVLPLADTDAYVVAGGTITDPSAGSLDFSDPDNSQFLPGL